VGASPLAERECTVARNARRSSWVDTGSKYGLDEFLEVKYLCVVGI
jgi:hypothetical protein